MQHESQIRFRRLGSREGVTLVLTISILVLFLLMGTAFVIVANDYFKTAKRRSQRNVYSKDSTAWLERAFYDVYRGIDLEDASSPLRGHGILEDLYGYGMKGNVSNAASFLPDSSEALVVVELDASTFTSIRTTIPIENYLQSDDYVDGVLNGRVISFIGGIARGYSTRIISHTHDLESDSLRIVIPRDRRGIDWNRVGKGDPFLINGREFSGYGAGELADHEDDPDAAATPMLISDTDQEGSINLLASTATRPNRIGDSRQRLTGKKGYLSNDQSPNEPHDAPDFHNMFLAGKFGDEIIPSFHRDQLYDYQYKRIVENFDVITPGLIRKFSFRPVHIASQYGSTAQEPIKASSVTGRKRSWFGRFNENGSRDALVEINDANSLDVDSDLDGENDAVWIDIGLPIQTDDQGRSYQPLVAYRILDMDGRLNLNAHGSNTDITTGSADRFGMGYGVAEISLSPVLGGQYKEILDHRYGIDNQAGATKNRLTPNYSVAQKMFGHPSINRLTSLRFATACDLFASISIGAIEDDPEAMPGVVASRVVEDATPYSADFGIVGGIGDEHFSANELEGLLRQNDIDAPLLDGRLGGLSATAATQLTTHSFEIAIPPVPCSIVELLRDRIADSEIEESDRKTVFDIFTSPSHIDSTNGRTFEMKYVSHEMLLGGRFDLNRVIGNGLDNDGNGVSDDSDELALGMENTSVPKVIGTQYGNAVFDLNNDPEINDRFAKQLMAKQLYILALLYCGDAAPEGYPQGIATQDGQSPGADELYRKSVAQWAVNVVDFYDPDSIHTVFEYDVYPFNDPRIPENLVDGDPRTNEESERGIVYGAERPEILINETFAHHDRQNEDTDEEFATDGPAGDITGKTLADGDADWDSRRVPQSSLYVELFHPHRQSVTSIDPRQGYQILPAELSEKKPLGNVLDSNVQGVDLGKLAPDETPVWRIAVHRGVEADAPDEHVRTIYFADPVNSKAPSPDHDCFFPEASPPTIMPYTQKGSDSGKQYLVLGTSGNVGNGTQTFGRLNSTAPGSEPTLAELSRTRSISIRPGGVTVRDNKSIVLAAFRTSDDTVRPSNGSIVDQFRKGHRGTLQSRGLSLSDPDGGYELPAGGKIRERDGIALAVPRDKPFDAGPAVSNRDKDDMQAIWTNGIKQDEGYQFRTLKLQRLANPLQPFHETANPYITVDLASVDLLSFNGLQNNPANVTDIEFDDSIGTPYSLEDGFTMLGGIERGEQIADAEGEETARQNLFRALGRVELDDDIGRVNDQQHNFGYGFVDAKDNNRRLETLGTKNASFDEKNQYSWVAWSNRPYSNFMEIANVPALSSEGMVRHFNRADSETEPVGATATADDAFNFYFGNDTFGHLLAFGSVVRDGTTQPNRFDRLLDVIEVPNRFLGSETFLRTRDKEGEQVYVPANGPLKFNLHPPFHTIPNFRYPGKVNLNTVSDECVWHSLTRGFGDLSYDEFVANRNQKIGPTDFGGLYTTSFGAEFTDDDSLVRKGADAGLFRSNEAQNKLTDSVDSDLYGAGTDVDATAVFRNELRTRLGISATTRSNVFAIWITIGYFDIDSQGRLGAEIGEEEGQVQRNRAFYIVDRSIPVASEPGRNHNVDEAVLVRTIMQ